MEKSNRTPWLILAFLCLVTYVYVIQGSINKPFATDEIYYAGWAWGISQNGNPDYYQGECETLRTRGVEPISHPTAHFNLLAVMILIFGLKYWSLRLLGVFMFMGFLWFVRAKVYKADPHGNEKLITLGALLCFNPLFLQESMVLAIEAQTFWFPLTVFLYVFHLETVNPPRFKYFPYIFSTLMMIVLLWFKETNIPIYTTVCVAYTLLTKRFKHTLFLLPTFLIAGALFWGSWMIYSAVTGVDLYCWYDFTFKNKLLKGSMNVFRRISDDGFAAAARFVWTSIKVSISWVTVPYVVLFFSAVYLRIRMLVRKEVSAGFTDLCIIYALVTFAVTKVVRPTIPFIKYETPAHLLMAVIMADVYWPWIRRYIRPLLAIVISAMAVGGVMYVMFPDRILTFKTSFPLHLLQAGVISAVATVSVAKFAKMRTTVALGFGLAAAVVALNTQLHIHQATAIYTTGQSWGNYGQDLVTPTKWLKENLENGEPFAAFKDLQFNLRFVEGKDGSPTYETRVFTKLMKYRRKRKKEILNSGEIRFIVLDRYSNSAAGRRFLEKNNYREKTRVAGHIIYERIKCKHCED